MSEAEQWVEIPVSDAMYRQMKAWADFEGVSVDELADRVLREYLDRQPQSEAAPIAEGR